MPSVRDIVKNRRVVRTALIVLLAAAAAAASWSATRPPAMPLRATLQGPKGYRTPLAFSPDGKWLAVETDGGIVELWDVATGKRGPMMKHPGQAAWPDLAPGAAFSPDGRVLAVSSLDVFRTSGSVTVFEVATGRQRTLVNQTKLGVEVIGFSADGATLAVIARNRVPNPNSRSFNVVWESRSWDTTTWAEQPTRLLPLTPLALCSFSPDLRTVADGDQRVTTSLWDPNSGAKLATLKATPPVTGAWSLQFSPDANTLGVGRMDGSLELWDLRTRTPRVTLRPHYKGFFTQRAVVSTRPDVVVSEGKDWGSPTTLVGQLKRLVARIGGKGRPAGIASQVVVWDVEARKPRYVLKGEGNPVLSPDGTVLATTDGSVKLWEVPPKRPPTASKRRGTTHAMAAVPDPNVDDHGGTRGRRVLGGTHRLPLVGLPPAVGAPDQGP
jgi:WD40 repeat protein